MKSTRQMLQSRISLRRNAIAHFEAEVIKIKKALNGVSDQGSVMYYRVQLGKYRKELSFLRLDQRLDKVLYVRLLNDAAWERELIRVGFDIA